MTFFGWFYIEKQKTSKLIQGVLKVKNSTPFYVSWNKTNIQVIFCNRDCKIVIS